MKHYYTQIHGWFEQTGLYDKALNMYDDALFVEVGIGQGKSTAYLGVEIINRKKNIKIDIIENDLLYTDNIITNLYDVRSVINKEVKLDKYVASHTYKEKSIDFLFFHTELNAELLELYWDKIKDNGILAGDDVYDSGLPGRVRGVNEYFGTKYIPDNTTYYPQWYIVK